MPVFALNAPRHPRAVNPDSSTRPDFPPARHARTGWFLSQDVLVATTALPRETFARSRVPGAAHRSPAKCLAAPNNPLDPRSPTIRIRSREPAEQIPCHRHASGARGDPIAPPGTLRQRVTKTTNTTGKKSNRPTHTLFHVTGEGDARNWTRIGAGWAHKDGLQPRCRNDPDEARSLRHARGQAEAEGRGAAMVHPAASWKSVFDASIHVTASKSALMFGTFVLYPSPRSRSAPASFRQTRYGTCWSKALI